MDAPAPTLVIFGATGDLTARKLVPALYSLARKGRLPQGLRVVGAARSPLDDNAFRAKMGPAVRKQAGEEWNEEAWNEFAGRLFYVASDAAKEGGLERLDAWLKGKEGGGPAPRLYYLAVGPDLYPGIATRLGEAGMSKESSPHGWRRIVIEKPFGRDLASARALNETIRAHFAEEQVYRIDHYLGKETVQNILVFRFANTLFEPLWNNNYVDHVQITVGETVPVGTRADYYDKYGVLRDMFQNHLLQLLALVALESPARFEANALRNEKKKVLDAVQLLRPEDAGRQLVTGQYAGYRKEKGVSPGSRTPTYAAVELNIHNARWRGVPFFLRSGKALAHRSSEVVIQFRCPPHLMFPLPEGSTLQCNRLSLCIQPDEGIHVNFQSKVPDREGTVLSPSGLEFHYKTAYPDAPIPEAYERLLQDALAGDASLFMRADEIERAWEILAPILAASEGPNAPAPKEYAVGSEGPAGPASLAEGGREWLSLCHKQD